MNISSSEIECKSEKMEQSKPFDGKALVNMFCHSYLGLVTFGSILSKNKVASFKVNFKLGKISEVGHFSTKIKNCHHLLAREARLIGVLV